MSSPTAPTIIDRAATSAGRALEALRSLQKTDGHWCAELEGDSILQSEYLLMKWILRQEDQPLADGRGPETLRRIVEQLRHQQREDGGWGQYPGSGIDVSATVKGYFVLKLFGDPIDAPHMRKARERVHELGGAERVNTYSRFFLACLGQVSWKAMPEIPPEIVLLPRWCYFHLDKVAAWTRTMIVPLAVTSALRPVRDLPSHLHIDELYLDETARHRLPMKADSPAFWRGFFKAVDVLLKGARSLGGSPWRTRSIERCVSWIEERAGQDAPAPTSGLGAIFPPMVYWQIVMHALGRPRSDAMVARAERELDEFMIEDETSGRIRLQPCFSPVWDTGIALYALADCGLDESDASASRAAAWLRSKECTFRGDWIRNVPGGPRGSGWFFEYDNAWYPDVDDTAMVAMALERTGGERNTAAGRRGVEWILSMQNADGGWAAFDRTEDRTILEHVPFADHNAMQDPSCPDITGRVLECLSWHGLERSNPSIERAIRYIKGHQRPDGWFFGRWGVNGIYGTWQAVIGPIRCGEPRSSAWIQRAGAWIKSIQKPDGSFGETANSYEDESLVGTGPSTASQTAWAAMILQEVHGPNDPDLARAIAWLCATQLGDEAAADPLRNPDGDPAGSWCETEFTGTGFPKVFYLRYHLYRLYFPLMALGRFVQAHGGTVATPRSELLTTGA